MSEALRHALAVIESYEADMRNVRVVGYVYFPGDGVRGATLASLGVCQGSVYRKALSDIEALRQTQPADVYFIAELKGEVIRARRKFPTNQHKLAALTEEVGELAQALIDRDRKQDALDAHVYAEAVQVAAMALRIATEGDASFKYRPPL